MKLSDIRRITQTAELQYGRDGRRMTAEYLRQLGLEPGILYQELEMESRYVDTHRDSSWSNVGVNLHSHSFYEVLCCRNTCGAEYLVGANRYQLQKGDIIIVAPDVSHCPLLPEHMPEPYKRDVIWIRPEFLAELQPLFPEKWISGENRTQLIRTAGTPWEFLTEKIHQGVLEAEQKAPGWELAVASNTVQLIVQMFRAVEDRTARQLKAEKPDLLEQVLAYVEEHLAEKITLADTARHFYISESTISQTFRKKMGISFSRCITQRRLISAKRLIEDGVLLEDVGHQVGFADYSSFYRAFRQEYGISPRQYRKLHQSGDQDSGQN